MMQSRQGFMSFKIFDYIIYEFSIKTKIFID